MLKRNKIIYIKYLRVSPVKRSSYFFLYKNASFCWFILQFKHGVHLQSGLKWRIDGIKWCVCNCMVIPLEEMEAYFSWRKDDMLWVHCASFMVIPSPIKTQINRRVHSCGVICRTSLMQVFLIISILYLPLAIHFFLISCVRVCWFSGNSL